MAADSRAIAAEPRIPDERFLAELRSRQLFSLAEAYCRQQLKRSRLTDEQRARLAVELSRTLVDRAAHAPPDERETRWTEALEVTEEFIDQEASNPWIALVKTQRGLAYLALGEMGRSEAELAPDDAERLREIRGHLRTAVRQLDELAGDLARLLRELRGASPRDGGLSRRQLQALEKNVQFSLARALRSQGQAYGPGTPDRTAALSRAVKLLEPLVQMTTADPLAWPSRLEMAMNLRLLKDHTAARRMLEQIEAEEPPPAVRQQMLAEQIRVELAEGKVDAALEQLGAAAGLGDATVAEFDIAVLEAYLAAWQQALVGGKATEADRLRRGAEQAATRVRARHDPLTARRAELLLAGSVTQMPGAQDVDLLVRSAEGYYRSGRLEEAIAAYDKASQQAIAAGNPFRAFELSFAAASVVHQRDDHAAAAERFHQLAVSHPEHPRAPEAHLLSIHHAGRLAAASGDAADGFDDYETWLEEHLRLWNDADSTDEARWRLARLREHQRRLIDALPLYEAIQPSSPRYEEAIARLGDLHVAQLAERQSSGEPVRSSAVAAAEFFERIALPGNAVPRSSWTAPQRAAALAAARIRIHYLGDDLDRVEPMLTAAMDDPETSPAWRHEALPLLVLAMASRGKSATAAEKLDELRDAPAETLLRVLEGLNVKDASGDGSAREAARSLRLKTAELLAGRLGELEPTAVARANLLHALSLADAGRTGEATQRLARLAEEHPRNAEIQEQYATLLSAAGDESSRAAAMTKWRELERGSRPGTPRWYRTKYALAELHLRSGNPDRAAELITLTQTLHPDLGGPAMKARFLELLARCRE